MIFPILLLLFLGRNMLLPQDETLLAAVPSTFYNGTVLFQNEQSVSLLDTVNNRSNRASSKKSQTSTKKPGKSSSQQESHSQTRHAESNLPASASNTVEPKPDSKEDKKSVQTSHSSSNPKDASKAAEQEDFPILPFLLGAIAGSIFTYFSLLIFAKRILSLAPRQEIKETKDKTESISQSKPSESISDWSPAPAEKRTVEQSTEATPTSLTVPESNSPNISEPVTAEALQEEQPKVNCLYFSIPNEKGIFSMNYASREYNAQSHHYKIEFSENSSEGKLFYVGNQNQHRRAIAYLDSYLKPVCNIENQFNYRNASSIEFLEPGKVNRVGDNWHIDQNQKIRIRLV